MTQHTPGPWRVIEQREGFQPYDRTVVHGQTNGTVAVRMTVADARLIAAAPEMLALLHRLILEDEQHSPEKVAIGSQSFRVYEMASTARALLARIEGKE